MEISNSADIYEDSGIKSLIHEMNIHNYFHNKDYGNNEVKIFFVVNCLLSHIEERRPKFDNTDKTLYLDIMLDYENIKRVSLKEKKIILANSVISLFNVLDKYKKLNLNKDAIMKDLKSYFEHLGWI